MPYKSFINYGVRYMNRYIMVILFIVISLGIGFGLEDFALLIVRKVVNKTKACTYSCLIGITHI
jgi:NADH:ubiquinone oxidoreductase subunit 3 (subunit A)